MSAEEDDNSCGTAVIYIVQKAMVHISLTQGGAKGTISLYRTSVLVIRDTLYGRKLGDRQLLVL